MRGLSTAFWSVVLLGSSISIAAGFAGGRSIVAADALKPQAVDTDLPDPVQQRIVTRTLIGPHSLDAAVAVDPYGDPDLAVASRPAGDDASFDARRDHARIAVIVVDAGRAGPGGLKPFLTAPVPLTLVVDPRDDGAEQVAAAIQQAGKSLVIDGSDATPGTVEHFVANGAVGVIASLGPDRSRALMHAVSSDAIVVDSALTEDDELYRIARKSDHRAFTRDVIADARDDGTYVEYMFRDALAIAQRHGTAIVAIHARSDSYDALVRFADRAQRDGADLVTLTDLAG